MQKAPYVQNGSVMVPFRNIFEGLNLQVIWDSETKTITGAGPDIEIILQVGSNLASVDGMVQQLSAAPVTLKGTTYVPIRFIGEYTGNDVKWNPALRRVDIDRAKVSEQDKKELTEFFNQYYGYIDDKNSKALASLYDPDFIDKDKVKEELDRYFAKYQFQESLQGIEFLSVKNNEAKIIIKETVLRTGGGYMPDAYNEITYKLTKIKDEWKISGQSEAESTILIIPEEAAKVAVVPLAEASAIKQTLEQHYRAFNDNNLKELLEVHTPTDSYVQNGYYTEMLDGKNQDIGLKLSLQSINTFYYGDHEAALYAVDKVTYTEDENIFTRGTIVHMVQITDGSWKIENMYFVKATVTKAE